MEAPTVVTNGEQTIDLPAGDVTDDHDTQVAYLLSIAQSGHSALLAV